MSIFSVETFNKIQEGQSKLDSGCEVADVHWGAYSCARLYTGCGGARMTDSLPDCASSLWERVFSLEEFMENYTSCQY